MDARVNVPIQGIVIQLTLFCPLACEHCYVSANSSHKKILSEAAINKIIHGLSSISAPQILAITGGEAFSAPEQLVPMVKNAIEKNIGVYINTSGYFGKNIDHAISVLKPFIGIKLLEVSFDRFHTDQLKMKYPVNACLAAHQLGIPVQLAILEEEREDPKILEVIKQLPFASLYIQQFAPAGERNTNTEQKPYAWPSTKKGGCHKVGALVFDEHGDAYPCSSAVVMDRRGPNGSNLKHFKLGNIYDDEFSTIIERYNQRKLISLVGKIGPSNVANVLFGTKRLRAPSYCDTCLCLFEEKLPTDSTLNELIDAVFYDN